MTKAPHEIIDEIGQGRLAEITGKNLGAIRQWRFKNRIPRGSWAYIVAAELPGLTLADLEASERLAGRDKHPNAAAA